MERKNILNGERGGRKGRKKMIKMEKGGGIGKGQREKEEKNAHWSQKIKEKAIMPKKSPKMAY